MDKYSVVLDDEKVKTGSASKTCPSCGRGLATTLILGTNTPETYCANCGTEPWEKRTPVAPQK